MSVVICAYTERRLADLEAAVASAFAQDGVDPEVVVVIDGDGELLDEARRRLSRARVVGNRFGRGLAGARNTGVAESRGEIVAFLDDDAAAEPGWLRALLAPYADPAVLGVGGAIVPAWAGRRPAWMPPEFDWVVGCSYAGQPEGRAPVRNMIGANMSARRDVLVALDGFRSALGRVGAGFQGHEETDLCIRGRQRWPERRWVLETAARVRHRVPRERACWTYFARRCWGEGRSKGSMVGSVGSQDGLATERRYVLRTLPAAVVRHAAAAARGEPAGLLRAAAVVAGLGLTAAGYARTRWARVLVPALAALTVLGAASTRGEPSHAARWIPSASTAVTWQRVFVDNFSHGLDPSRWGTYSGQPGGDPGGWWDPSHVVVRRGILRLRTYRDPAFDGRWVSGGVSSARALKQTYGRYRVRFRMTRGLGVAGVLLLWPVADHWPPEIDFAEDGGETGLRRTMTATLHYGEDNRQIQRSVSADFTEWHTMGVDWLPGLLRFTLDGQVWARIRSENVPAEPMELDLQTQAGTCGDPWAPCPDATTPERVTMQVDRVVAYALHTDG